MGCCSDKDEAQPTTNRPPDNAFQQQKLKAWQPLLTPNWVMATFAIVGIIFVPIGIVIMLASDGIYEDEMRYDNQFEYCDVAAGVCPPETIEFTFTRDVEGPLYFYYKLSNFYQNHRRYVKSRSDSQLRGQDDPDLSACDPLEKYDFNGTGLKNIYPCGLIANSFFNDTFSAKLNNEPLNKENGTWDEENIAWPSDADKFEWNEQLAGDEATRTGPGGFMLPNVTDEHFQVWMRTAGLPTFKKLYAKMTLPDDQVFKEGDVLTVSLINTFPVAAFDGEKAVVISTTSWLGGKNSFLGYSYIVVGALCLFLALVFFIKEKKSPRNLGDMNYFNWPTQLTNKPQ